MINIPMVRLMKNNNFKNYNRSIMMINEINALTENFMEFHSGFYDLARG